MTQESQQHSQHHCPDPTEPFKDYLIESAVVKKASELYAADVLLVTPGYEQLSGAQTRYANAKKAQQDAYDELTRRLQRARDNLYCSLDQSERNELIRCWKDLLKETRPPYDHVKCQDLDNNDPKDLPEERKDLTELLDRAVKCAARADARFYRLIGVPEGLADRISALADRATTLEQSVCTAENEQQRRNFVQYLELNKDFEELVADWIDATQYGCKLKRFFRALLKRHIWVIVLRIAIERLDQYDARVEAEKEEKKNNLIDFVLECASPEPGMQSESAKKPDYAERSASESGQEQGGPSTQTTQQTQESTPDEEEV